MRIDENTLAQLPHDGNPSHLTSVTVESQSPAAISPATESPAMTDQPDTTTDNGDPYDVHLPQ